MEIPRGLLDGIKRFVREWHDGIGHEYPHNGVVGPQGEQGPAGEDGSGGGGTGLHEDLTDVTANQHHNEAHTVASHSDTTATGAELEALTDGSDADALHLHPDNAPDFDDATSNPLIDADSADDGNEDSPARKDHVHPKHHAAVTASGAHTMTGQAINATAASVSQVGHVEIAIASEVNTGTSAALAVSPDSLAGSYAGTKSVSILVSDPGGDAITTGNTKASFLVPSALNGMELVAVAAGLTTVSSSGAVTVMVRRNRRTAAGTRGDADMLSTALTIDASEFSSVDAATAAVIKSDTSEDVVTGDQIHIDIDGAGTGAKGLQVVCEFRLP